MLGRSRVETRRDETRRDARLGWICAREHQEELTSPRIEYAPIQDFPLLEQHRNVEDQAPSRPQFLSLAIMAPTLGVVRYRLGKDGSDHLFERLANVQIND